MVQTKPMNFKRYSAGGLRHGPFILSAVIAFMAVMLISSAFAIDMNPNYYNRGGGNLAKPAVSPNQTLRVHRIGNVYFSITNYGKLGSEGRALYDPLTSAPAPSCEFPAGTNLDYLFQGCFWIGAVRENPDEPGELDTLVSIADDGWWSGIYEFNPNTPPKGEIMMLSIRGENSPPYAPDSGELSDMPGRTFNAISEQDFICVYTDTVLIGITPDPNDNRPHIPLNLQILQKSYSWSYEYAEDFILIDYEITNIGDEPLEKVWIGLYIDADVAHTSEDGYGIEEGAQDDICGFLKYFHPQGIDDSTEIFTAWIADNDGQPQDGAFVSTSARGLSGCRVVQSPLPEVQYGFNWWISNINSQLDWGPQLDSNYTKWHEFPGGGRGTPGGDRAKYQVMSNHEFDYDQIWCALDWTDQGWIPNNASDPSDLANGYDTRYLYSFGEFPEIQPGETLPLTIAYICGDKLHKDPNNCADNLFNNTDDSASIATYYNNLDFRDFATNAQWAEWVYDNPGRDSCWNAATGQWELDNNRGEYRIIGEPPDTSIFYYKGDGCPDFKGPPPPFSPKLNFDISKGQVKIYWPGINDGKPGTGPEDGIDSFNGKKDFEGYAIYNSYDALNWTLMRRFDKVDYLPVTWDITVTPNRWVTNKEKQYPISADSVHYLAEHDPLIEDLDVTDWDSTSGHTYWVSYGLNTGFAEILDDTVKTTPDGDTIRYYSFDVSGLSRSRGIYFSITAFDYGDPLTDLGSLESAKSINATLVYPIEKADPIMVYPNPYKITDTERYINMGYEDPNRTGWHEQSRRIWFSNLPDEQRAIIRIWTLDGDLVRTLTYDPTTVVGNPPGLLYWDLVSRNGQAVVSGLYLYSIEFIAVADGVPDRDSEIGKFVIIK